MAKLYFYYSAMNAGKTTLLLQSAHNYRERGMDCLLFTPEIDTRYGKNKITSRVGLQLEAITFDSQLNFFEKIKHALLENPKLKCILLDECHFLAKQQVEQLCQVVDKLNIPVLTYGLRTDFLGEPFEGSQYLLAWADNLVEVKTICHCGRKAIMNMRIDADGEPIKQGNQVQIGGNESYLSMCRKHFMGAIHTVTCDAVEAEEVT